MPQGERENREAPKFSEKQTSDRVIDGVEKRFHDDATSTTAGERAKALNLDLPSDAAARKNDLNKSGILDIPKLDLDKNANGATPEKQSAAQDSKTVDGKDARGNEAKDSKTTEAKDSKSPEVKKNPDGCTSEVDPETGNTKTTKKNPDGSVVTTETNPEGKKLSTDVSKQDGKNPDGSPRYMHSRTEYDPETGKKTSTDTERNGTLYHSEYNEDEKLSSTEVTQPDGTSARTEFDPETGDKLSTHWENPSQGSSGDDEYENGRKVASTWTDGAGNEGRTEYNPETGHKKSVLMKSKEGDEVRDEFDQNGKLKTSEMKNHDGSSSKILFDPKTGHMKSFESTDTEGVTNKGEYNPKTGKMTSWETSQPDGTTERTVFDAANVPKNTVVTKPDGSTEVKTYDPRTGKEIKKAESDSKKAETAAAARN